MKKLIVFTMVIGLIMLFSVSHHAFASDCQICVFQESTAGLGDFAFLGAIDVFDRSSESAGDVYSYGKPNRASYNGDVWSDDAPDAIEETSQLFVVKTNDGSGVSLFIVHDKYEDEEGGNADMQLNLTGDTAGVLVEDDPWETIIISEGGTQFNTDHRWFPCCTDGGVIGTLEGTWAMDIQFLSVDMTRITAWQATSADGSTIPLALELERRVRLQPCPIVAIDIKPYSCPNPFNLPQDQDIVDLMGILTVAIPGTETLDVMCIDPQSIKISRECDGCEPVAPLRWAYEDVATPFEGKLCECHEKGMDGYMDLKLKFKREALAEKLKLYDVAGQPIPLTIIGNLKEQYGGMPISGQGCVRIDGKRAKYCKH